jgi:hypothetical protein
MAGYKLTVNPPVVAPGRCRHRDLHELSSLASVREDPFDCLQGRRSGHASTGSG